METYLVEFNPEENKGVFAISLVENPAIEEVGIYLSKEDELVQLKEIEKGLLMSPVLIPNQKILRVDESGNPFNIMFTKEVIELSQRHFHINGYQSQSTEEHDYNLKLNGVTIVESWIKEFDQDKSNEYGYDLPIGTWFAIMKVDNEDVKAKIKSGEIKGFSIDGSFKLNNYKMSKEHNFLKALKDLINPTEEVKVELTDQVTEEEKLEEDVVVAASMEVGSVVPDGMYTAEDGTSFSVVDGKISEVKEMEVVVEEEIEVDMATQLSTMKNEILVAVGNLLESNNVQLKKEFYKSEEIALTAETKASPEVKTIKEPKNLREKLFNELQNK
jgi:hypothetical protein